MPRREDVVPQTNEHGPAPGRLSRTAPTRGPAPQQNDAKFFGGGLPRRYGAPIDPASGQLKPDLRTCIPALPNAPMTRTYLPAR